MDGSRLSEPIPATEIELHFADGEYLFKLGLPQIAELQSKCTYTDRAGSVREMGILEIYSTVLAGQWQDKAGTLIGVPHEGRASQEMIFETIRLGLIGGGRGTVNEEEVEVTPLLARRLMERYIHPIPLEKAWNFAAAILRAKIVGYSPPDKKKEELKKPLKKPRAGSTTRKRSPTAQ